MAYNTGSPEKRFYEKVEMIPFHPCWEWVASRFPSGYGAFDKKTAHRFSYRIHNGPIPKGLHVRHTCDNRGCVNPKHLAVGTHQDNMDDRTERNRTRNQNTEKTHCKRGHALFGDNAYKNPSGSRQCKICQKAIFSANREKYNANKRLKRRSA